MAETQAPSRARVRGRYATPEQAKEFEVFQRWKAELEFAQKDKQYTKWLDRCKQITRRYRDERQNEYEDSARKLNILWSNTQTLKPALYGKQPKPIVERRFMDRDPVARVASTVLERVLSFQMEVGYYHASTDHGVLDYLLYGMGQSWLRYEPTIESEIEGYENEEVQAQEKTAEEIAEEGDGEPYETLAYEKVCDDYVYYQDFLWSPARCWNEVRWAARRSFLEKAQIEERFGKEKADKITLDYVPDRMQGETYDEKTVGYFKKATVWEIWNKPDRKVYFVAPGTAGMVLEVRDDPLHLEGFWPCPEPLFATQTNDTIVPVPDYAEYQDQAKELDDLTNRIARVTTAVKVAGVYNSEYDALARLLQEGVDNKLVPVDSWAAFAEKGGVPGAISLVPLKDIIETLLRLYEARAQVKSDLYEITGISDIVRGYSGAGGAKTATEQRIKGQFASLRLEDRRAAVARFCRDKLCIMGEMVSEIFSDDSLFQMSGYAEIVRDKVRQAVERVPKPQPPQLPPETPPEQAQAMQAQAQQQFQIAQQQASQQAQQQAMQEFQGALEILRSDKLRGFRIDIETDSTIQVDAQADKEAAIELVNATFQGLSQAGEVFAAVPELVKPIGDLLMFAYRRFRVGRTVEAEFSEAFDQMVERIENPGPQKPTEEEIKAQAEQAKQQAESQREQMRFQAEMQEKQMDLQMKEREHELKIAEMNAEWQLEQNRFALEERKMGLKEREMQMQAALKSQQAQQKQNGAEAH